MCISKREQPLGIEVAGSQEEITNGHSMHPALLNEAPLDISKTCTVRKQSLISIHQCRDRGSSLTLCCLTVLWKIAEGGANSHQFVFEGSIKVRCSGISRIKRDTQVAKLDALPFRLREEVLHHRHSPRHKVTHYSRHFREVMMQCIGSSFPESRYL